MSRPGLRLCSRLVWIILLAATFTTGWTALTGGEPPIRPAKPVAVSPRLESASNPTTLQLQADDQAVYGWVSGSKSYAGEAVQMTCGNRSETVTVGEDNTFIWKHNVKDSSSLQCALGKLRASLPLSPSTPNLEPSAYFVVDRTAYRPGQTLQFAAYLRQVDDRGEFVPLAHTDVEVVLASRMKGLVANRWNVRSDDLGRVVGSYVFRESDLLEHYELRIANFKGTAEVLLAEYRKSKVRLQIRGTLTNRRMALRFDALDFLNQPIAVGHGRFVAQVIRKNAPPSPGSLRVSEFISPERSLLPRLDYDGLSDDELLFHEVQREGGLIFASQKAGVVTEVRGELKFSGGQALPYTIDLKPAWLQGGYELIVHGVVTDINGREQVTTETIPFVHAKADVKKPVELLLLKTHFAPNEPIEVTLGGSVYEKKKISNTELLVLKLAYNSSEAEAMPPNRITAGRPSVTLVKGKEPKRESVRRTPVASTTFNRSVAKLSLPQAGTYQLVVKIPNGNGTVRYQAEATILVKRPETRPSFVIRLDTPEFANGEFLTGTIRSRFADAKALLTLRDSSGIRFTKPIVFRDGLYRLQEPLPPGLKYGCALDVLYPEDDTSSLQAQAFARVVPADRMLKVNITSPDRVAPGSFVQLDVQVDRQEPIDLIASVYDSSLLAIEADSAPDIRNYYYADDRIRNRLDLVLLRRRLGDIRIKTLLERGQQSLQTNRLMVERRGEWSELWDHVQRKQLTTRDVASLLRLAGLEVYCSKEANGSITNWWEALPDRDKPVQNPRLVDLFDLDSKQKRLEIQFVGNTLLLQESFAQHVPPSSHRWHPAFGWDDGDGYLWKKPTPTGMRNGGASNFGIGGGFGGGGIGGFGGGIGGGGFGGQPANSGRTAASPSPSLPNPENFTALALSNTLPVAAAPEVGDDLPALPDLVAATAVRRNFSDTAYWNATIRTDGTGHATVMLKLPDTLTRWQVVVTAVSPRMHVGGAKASIHTFQPIMVWPMLPRCFTAGDSGQVFASVHNRTAENQTVRVRLKTDAGTILTPAEVSVDLKPMSNAPVRWTYAPPSSGEVNLLMTAESTAGSDAAAKRLSVNRCSAEQVVALSGFADGPVTLDLPRLDAASQGQLELTFAPSLAADLSDTLSYLVDYPYGCVEQTMSRFLPAIRVSQILQQYRVPDRELEKKLPGVAAAGIKRLTELQNKDGTWGWWGKTAANEMMTAYALYGLLLAEDAGYKVDPAVLKKGRAALKGFVNKRDPAADADRVYGLYVLSLREKTTDDSWVWLEERASANTLSDCSLAFALEMAVRGDRPKLARQFADVLKRRAVVENGAAYWQTAGFSRWGDDRFEVTAAAFKALVAWGGDEALVEQTVTFFVRTKNGNRWNSTKDTAMILFAFCDYLAKKDAAELRSKPLKLTIGGREHVVKFDGQLATKVVIPAEQLPLGKIEMLIETEMKGVTYRAVFRYWKSGRNLEPMAKGLVVERKFTLVNEKGTVLRSLSSGDTVPQGSFIRSEVLARSQTPGGMRYLLVENPKPGGCETIAPQDKRFEKVVSSAGGLREDRDAKVCYHHEEAPNEVRDSSVFVAELAGEFVAAPAAAELMYHPETRGQSGTFVLKVQDRK
jgi:hypothetical protein